MNKRDNGITLVALVITIIVLLILAGISITLVVGDNGVLEKARQSTLKTEQGEVYEQISLATASGDMEYYTNGTDRIIAYKNALLNEVDGIDRNSLTDDGFSLITGIVIGKSGKTYDFSISLPVTNITVTEHEIVDRTGISIGDYVNYVPDVPSSTTYPVSTLATYSGSDKNTSDINQENIKWRVLRIYEDGSIDLIGDITYKEIYFYGIKGYTNGVYLINDICKTLYSNTEHHIYARSVNLEDYEYWLEQSSNGINARNSSTNGVFSGDIVYYGQTRDITTNNICPAFYLSQKNESDPGTLVESPETIQQTPLTLLQTMYKADIYSENYADGDIVLNGGSSGYSFWIASRFCNVRIRVGNLTSPSQFRTPKSRKSFARVCGSVLFERH